jgi:hypothetical protein
MNSYVVTVKTRSTSPPGVPRRPGPRLIEGSSPPEQRFSDCNLVQNGRSSAAAICASTDLMASRDNGPSLSVRSSFGVICRKSHITVPWMGSPSPSGTARGKSTVNCSLTRQTITLSRFSFRSSRETTSTLGVDPGCWLSQISPRAGATDQRRTAAGATVACSVASNSFVTRLDSSRNCFTPGSARNCAIVGATRAYARLM